jgi:hypothetical protein
LVGWFVLHARDNSREALAGQQVFFIKIHWTAFRARARLAAHETHLGPRGETVISKISALDAAIEAAKRGWFVFPLRPGTKLPMLPWRKESTDSHERIMKWHLKYPDCNWGLDCGKSQLVVLDVDKRADKDGVASLMQLELEHGANLRETFTVTTPSGGKHHYFHGEAGSSNGFRTGLDLKSEGGYVVLYGSGTVNGTYWISNAHDVVPAPNWLKDLVREARPRHPQADATLTEPDQPEYIAWAINWLENEAPESVEGQGGDDTLVKRVLMPLRDGGISKVRALDLILEHYNNTKSFPAWTVEELAVKVENAWRYALSPAGNATPEGQAKLAAEVFSVLPVLPPPVEAADDDEKLIWVRGSEYDSLAIPRRRWVMNKRFLRGYITGTFSPGGVGKSNLSYLEALAVATNLPLSGEAIIQSGPVVLFNAEDSMDELKMRLDAVCQFHGIDRRQLGKKYHEIMLVSGRDMKLRVAGLSEDRRSYVLNPKDVARLRKMIQQAGAILFVGDPFIRLHDAPENDNVAIDKVAEVFTDVAHVDDVSMHLVHHTRKRSNDTGAGDAEASRGASSFVNAMRTAHTLTTMSEDEAKHYGVVPEMRAWYIQLCDAKLNLAPPASETRWYKKISVQIPNGEHVGTLQRVQLEVVEMKTQYGLPYEIERAAELSEIGVERALADIAKVIVNTNPSEDRDARTIAQAIRRRLLDGKPLKVGQRQISLVVHDGGRSGGKEARNWIKCEAVPPAVALW